MVNDNLINFEKSNVIYLIVNGKVQKDKMYEIIDIYCETIGSMITGHKNIYYALLKDIVDDNIFKTMIVDLDLLTERSDVYAIKISDLN